jgi:hypothetical protein
MIAPEVPLEVCKEGERVIARSVALFRERIHAQRINDCDGERGLVRESAEQAGHRRTGVGSYGFERHASIAAVAQLPLGGREKCVLEPRVAWTTAAGLYSGRADLRRS